MIRHMKIGKFGSVLMAVIIAGCTGDTDRDTLIDSGPLEDTEVSGIWVDPNGCDHWVIKDILEGYMTPRLHPDGRPVCRRGAILQSYTELE